MMAALAMGTPVGVQLPVPEAVLVADALAVPVAAREQRWVPAERVMGPGGGCVAKSCSRARGSARTSRTDLTDWRRG